jgi:hypothetical protein
MADSSEKYYELHEYRHLANTIEGQVERILFPLICSLDANKGDLSEVRRLVKIAFQRLEELGTYQQSQRQLRLAQVVKQYAAMPESTSELEAARTISIERFGDDGHTDEIRQDLRRGKELRDAGRLNPSITDGSSTHRLPLDRKPGK